MKARKNKYCDYVEHLKNGIGYFVSIFIGCLLLFFPVGSVIYKKIIPDLNHNCLNENCYVLSSQEGGMSVRGLFQHLFWKIQPIFSSNGRLVTWGEFCSRSDVICNHYWFTRMVEA
jgi:hypothetical protein